MSQSSPSLVPFRAVDTIRKKRDGREHTREDIGQLISAYTHGQIPDYQVAAWLMAVVLKGMTRAETADLTEAMLHSGEVLDLSSLPGVKVDKHSTGGVGDKTSLVLAPVAAAGGLLVPMISGRGLGHTGGTLDKLEAIPGFNVNLALPEFVRVLRQCGCAIVGQTPEIAPADKKLYALRDVTATVDSPALICASIMSKKLAEGIDALLLDVKTGNGAFMKKREDAAFLAELMVETGQRMGKKVVALLTNMDQPLGRKVGNALEVEECIEILRGEGPGDLRALCLELCGWMFKLGGKCTSVEKGKEIAAEIIGSGQGLAKFREMVRAQGGDERVVDDPARLPQARHTAEVLSPHEGFVSQIQCEQIGIAGMLLGGGREKKDDTIDPAVGLVLRKKLGERVARGEPLCTLHYNAAARAAAARPLIEASYVIADEAPASLPPLVQGFVCGAESEES